MQIYERLGVDQALAASSIALSRIELCTHDGELLQRVDLDEARREYGYATHSIHRAVFQKILAESFGLEKIHFQKECVRVREPADSGQVHLEFKDGTEIAADLVIGADGLRSKVREFVQPAVPLRDSKQTCFRGIAHYELPEELRLTCREIWGVKHRFGFSAIAPGRVYWFAPVSQPVDVSLNEAAAELQRIYGDFPALIRDILAATPPQSILRTDLMDFEPLERWHRGRVVLLGDAAHATTPNLGQGAAQAAESAYVLARSLSTHDEIEAALRHYGDVRRDKAHYVTRTAWMIGQAAHYEGGFARTLRDLALKNTPEALQERQLKRLYALGY
jgi:2-polyprenyl-6-methoxyphenol hydroxylase-like FAD-dependent oxidoreductase